jgi:hypothetical protein
LPRDSEGRSRSREPDFVLLMVIIPECGSVRHTASSTEGPSWSTH